MMKIIIEAIWAAKEYSESLLFRCFLSNFFGNIVIQKIIHAISIGLPKPGRFVLPIVSLPFYKPKIFDVEDF